MKIEILLFLKREYHQDPKNAYFLCLSREKTVFSSAVNIAFITFLKRSRFESGTGTRQDYDQIVVQNIGNISGDALYIERSLVKMQVIYNVCRLQQYFIVVILVLTKTSLHRIIIYRSYSQLFILASHNLSAIVEHVFGYYFKVKLSYALMLLDFAKRKILKSAAYLSIYLSNYLCLVGFFSDTPFLVPVFSVFTN